MSLALLYLVPGLLLGWTLGGNDAANVFGPAVATGSVRFRVGAAIAALFVLLGATLQGHHGVATYSALSAQTASTSALIGLAAALTVGAFLRLGVPVSVTQTVIGALVGLSLVHGGTGALEWRVLVRLVVAWTVAPLGAGLLTYVLYRVARPGLEIRLRGLGAYDRLIALGFLIVSAYGAYSLGANNVANVTGVYVGAGVLDPLEGALLGGAAIALGMMTGSRRVIDTVGIRITRLTSLGGLVVLVTEALVLHMYAMLGIPISASQAVVGGIVGVGLVKGVWAVNRPLTLMIGASWFGAPLIAGTLSGALFLSVRGLMKVF